jgi:hypothetical protein
MAIARYPLITVREFGRFHHVLSMFAAVGRRFIIGSYPVKRFMAAALPFLYVCLICLRPLNRA